MSTATINRAPTALHRSLEQRQEALRNANRIRSHRRLVKEEVAENWQRAARAIADDEPDLATMKVRHLLLSVRKLGRVKVDRMLRVVGVSPYKTIGGLSARQRSALLLALARHHGGKLPLGSRVS
jgi:hypothetical protein